MRNKILNIIFSSLFILIGLGLLILLLIFNKNIEDILPFIIVISASIAYGAFRLINTIIELKQRN